MNLSATGPDLTVVLPSYEEAANLAMLLPALRKTITDLGSHMRYSSLIRRHRTTIHRRSVRRMTSPICRAEVGRFMATPCARQSRSLPAAGL